MQKSDNMRLMHAQRRARESLIPNASIRGSTVAVATGPCAHSSLCCPPSHALCRSLSHPVCADSYMHAADRRQLPTIAASVGRQNGLQIPNGAKRQREFDIVEFACSDVSTIGELGPRLGVPVVRLTLKTCNLTSKLGFRKALSIVRENHGASMHSSTPCTPWSTWNHMNSHKLGHAFNLKLSAKRAESLQMLTYFSCWRKRL